MRLLALVHRYRRPIVGTAAVVSFLFVLLPLAFNMPLGGPDSPFHFKNTIEFVRQMDEGNFYPRWCYQMYGGLGLPVFYIYPPLAYMLTWLVHAVTSIASIGRLMTLTSVVMLLLSTGTGYLYFRRYGARLDAWIAAILYAGLPHRAWDFLFRPAYAEDCAFIGLPLLFIGIDLAFEGKESRLRSTLLTSLSIALIVYSNIPTAGLLLLALPIYIGVKLWLSGRPISWQPVTTTVLSGLLGVTLCGLWLLPALDSLPKVLSEVVYRPNFVQMYEVVGVFAINRSNIIFLPCMMALLSAGLLGVHWRTRQTRRPSAMTPWIALLAVTVFLEFPISWPVWQHFRPLDVPQFASRWGIVLCMVVPMIYLLTTGFRAKAWSSVVLIVVLCVSNYHLIPGIQSNWEWSGWKESNPPWHDPIEYIPRTVDSAITSPYVIHALLRQVPPVTVRTPGVDSASVLPEVRRTPASTALTVSASKPFTLELARLLWPTWRLRLQDGRSIPLRRAEYGVMQATMPAGSYRAELHIERSQAEIAGAWLSLAGGLIYLATLLVAIVNRKTKPASLL